MDSPDLKAVSEPIHGITATSSWFNVRTWMEFMCATGVSHNCILFSLWHAIFPACHDPYFFSSNSSRTTNTKKKETIGWPLEYWPQNWSQKLGVHTMKNKHTPSLLTLIVSFTCVFSEEKPRMKLPWRTSSFPSLGVASLLQGWSPALACCGLSAYGQCLCYS